MEPTQRLFRSVDQKVNDPVASSIPGENIATYDNRAPTIDGIERVLMAAREPRYTTTDVEVSGASRVDGWGKKTYS